jgi:hypothetical protein
MSEQEDLPRNMPNLIISKPNPIKRFEYASTHIAAITAAVTASIGLGATCMLFGYVWALDRDLLRLVQYSDVLQFALETVIFLGFALLALWLYTFVTIWRVRRNESPPKPGFERRFIGIFSSFYFLCAVYVLATRAVFGIEFLPLDLNVFAFYALTTSVTAFLFVRFRELRRPGIVMVICVNAVILLIATGSISEKLIISTSRSYDVSAKEQFNDVIIALTLARGTVLYDRKAEHIIVIRESDITKIVPHGEKAGNAISRPN